jgi:flavin reductase (DIM6/NTAB) family NADH-FMN oxidoreductase RutF
VNTKIVSIETEKISRIEAYRLLISAVVPRPIAWVSTIGRNGVVNLAPFSFFNAVGKSPPSIMVSIEKRGDDDKDTLRNVKETGEMVVHIVHESLMEQMVFTSGCWSYDINEFEEAGLETTDSIYIKPPRIKDTAVAMEIKSTQIIPIEGTNSTMIIGKVLIFHIREDLFDDRGTIDASKLHPIARLGGSDYAKLGEVFRIRRPEVIRK